KIEGRLKTPEYVANITAHYRRAIDAAVAGRPVQVPAADVPEMEMSFSRGITPGGLHGNDHKRVVPGTDSSNRGLRVGEVIAAARGRVTVRLSAGLRRGDGVAFDGDRAGGHQQGGRLYGLRDATGELASHPGGDAEVELEFGRDAIDTRKI